jgi:hypothetical protein
MRVTFYNISKYTEKKRISFCLSDCFLNLIKIYKENQIKFNAVLDQLSREKQLVKRFACKVRPEVRFRKP